MMANWDDKEALLSVPGKSGVSVAERLAKARAAKAARDARDEEEAQANELERLELVEKYEAEVGRENRAFVIVDVTDRGEGFIVLRLGEDVLWKTFSASKMGVVDMDAFVSPCLLSPSPTKYVEIVARRPFVADRCATALAGLFGVKSKEDSGK